MRQATVRLMMLGAAAAMPVRAAADPSNPLVQALARCVAIKPDAERLACFDAAGGKLVSAERTRDLVVVSRDEVRRTKRSLFGLAIDQNAVFAGHDATADRVDRLQTTLLAAVPTGNDRWSLALAEGGRWRTTEAWMNGDPKPGMAVEIHPGALGSYVLRIRGQAAVRVARIN